MKRHLVFVALALVLCFGLANGQTSVTIESITGEFGTDTLAAGQVYTAYMKLTNVGTGCNFNPGNGYRIYSPDGATWTTISGQWENNFEAAFGVIASINRFPAAPTGTGADSINFTGASSNPSNAFNDGWDDVAYSITFGPTQMSDHGKTICIDSSYTPPGGVWKWVALSGGCGTVFPSWDGPYCWTLYEVPDLPPEMVDCPTNYSFNHCDVGTIDFDAEDPDHDPPGGEILEFELVSGPGTINPATGVWSWSGGTVPLSGFATIEVRARTVNTVNPAFGEPCSVNIEVLNSAPAFIAGCGTNTFIQTGDNKCVDFDVADDNCDVHTYTVTDAGGATGAITTNADGVVCYAPADTDADLPQPLTFTVEVSDGELTAECTITWEVSAQAPYQIVLEKVHNQIQGQFTTVDITLNGIEAQYGLGAFDFLIAYDASALSFQQAQGGTIYDECGWEYFTYRFGPDGNCGNACPSGMLRVVGIAETNNGPNHPGCQTPTPYVDVIPTTLAELTFLVSNDRTLECQYVPIRFFWIDCGDNVLSSWDGARLFVSTKVYDFESFPISGEDNFPTYLGAQAECLIDVWENEDKPPPIRNIDFRNGGIDIVCADSIDARGDINVNGLAYEIADAVMFTNYFVNGLSAFGDHVDASVAASDTNADGIPLSVADLVYLIRVIVGDADAYPKVNPVAATYVHDMETGVLSVDADMGAAALTVAGDATPILLSDNMEMQYRFDGTNTNVIVYSLEGGQSFSGEFLSVQGEIINIEMATYDAAPVAAKAVPANYSLAQNYPNPFNPTTTFSFQLKQAGEWRINIFNVTGQLVEEISGYDEAGQVDVMWDASEKASGIYFYKLEAGTFTATKKAVLLK